MHQFVQIQHFYLIQNQGLSGVLSSQHLFLSEKNPPSIDLTILVEDTNLLPGYGSKNVII